MQPENPKELWRGLRDGAREQLTPRDYQEQPLNTKIWQTGLTASEAIALREQNDPALQDLWIPGVEIFSRKVFVQRHRGFFGELGRRDEGVFGRLGIWPVQWSASLVNAGTCKGFHVHPPFIPEGEDPIEHNRRLFGGETPRLADCPTDREQWDIMFFLTGRVELLLIDERAGLSRRRLRFWIDGDNHRGPDNAGLVIPAGVAHALRPEGSEDLLMTYGTTTTFHPEFEGRIASGIETAELPADWQTYLAAAPQENPHSPS